LSSARESAAAIVDTSVIAALKLYDPAELPETILITAVTLGELSFGPARDR
jgi:predicted nucleic acid-binding protein